MVKRNKHIKAPPLTRSEIMSRVRSRNTSPELAIRSYLWVHGVRFKLNQRIEGTLPDIAWRGRKVAVFIDGCFWHGCPLHCRRPSTRKDYWTPKIDGNMQRDIENTKKLHLAGWVVLRYWEHEIRENRVRVADTIMKELGADIKKQRAWRKA